MTEMADRIAGVKARITAAAEAAGRAGDDVTLVAVTKTWPAAIVLDAYRHGLRHFGENRPEELAQKRREVDAQLGPGNDIVWHQIGTVQSRKSGLVAASAGFFHALDRLKIARRLDRDLAAAGRRLPVLLEVNVSGEASKAGLPATHWEKDATERGQVRQMALDVAALPQLDLVGLMTMAPWNAPATEVAEIFGRTAKLQRWLQESVPSSNWSHLSMGMTDDYELAITAGATLVRIGRAIFGDRR